MPKSNATRENMPKELEVQSSAVGGTLQAPPARISGSLWISVSGSLLSQRRKWRPRRAGKFPAYRTSDHPADFPVVSETLHWSPDTAVEKGLKSSPTVYLLKDSWPLRASLSLQVLTRRLWVC